MKYQETIKNFLGQIKNTRLLIIIFIVGILLIALPTDSKSDVKEVVSQERDSCLYKEETERQLKKVLSKVSGAGSVDVMITLSDDGDVSYAADEKNESTTKDSENTKIYEKSYVIKNETKGGEAPVIVKKSTPTVSGVLVVASGAKDAVVKNELINAVKAVLGVRAHRVYVLEKK